MKSSGHWSLARVMPGAGVPAGGSAVGSDRMYVRSVLSDARTLIRALDCGWCFAFLCSASLFALSLPSGFSEGEEMFPGGPD